MLPLLEYVKTWDIAFVEILGTCPYWATVAIGLWAFSGLESYTRQLESCTPLFNENIIILLMKFTPLISQP